MQVRCIVRPRQNPADFLRDWGATTVQADLGDPSSLPATLVGIHTVIDCATARPEESTQKVDWEGKKALIQCAQVGLSSCACSIQMCMNVQHGLGLPVASGTSTVLIRALERIPTSYGCTNAQP